MVHVSLLPPRRPSYDLDKVPGPWVHAKPVVGNILECLRPDFHRQLLDWSDQYGGIYRLKFLWQVGAGGALSGGGVMVVAWGVVWVCLEECVSVPACWPAIDCLREQI
jgi:hypothetical protein